MSTITLKVVPVDPKQSATPTCAYRKEHMKVVHVEKCASEAEVFAAIRAELKVPEDQSLQFMYTMGRAMRPANIGDVDGATSWDGPSVSALHGSGHLYVALVRNEVVSVEKTAVATSTIPIEVKLSTLSSMCC